MSAEASAWAGSALSRAPASAGLKWAGLLASVLMHGALLAAIAAGGVLDRPPPPRPDKAIDLVGLEEFLPPPPAPAAEAPAADPRLEAPPPAPPPSQEAPPPPRPDLPVMAEEAGGEASPTAMVLPSIPAPPPPPAASAVEGGGAGGEVEYLPQHRIDTVPVPPAKEINSRIVYPPLAAKQGIEATVFLELFIDSAGRVSKITVLKDPGFGFAEAALSALAGVVFEPARSAGMPVASRYRYPVRFKLK